MPAATRFHACQRPRVAPRAYRSRRRWGPGGRAEPAPPVGGERDGGIRAIEIAVPQLAGDLLVMLVQPLAVVRELASAHQMAVAEVNLAEPVGVREALAGGSHDVGLAALEDALRLLEGHDAAAGDDRCVETRFAHGGADGGGERHVAPEGAACVRDDGGHALVPGLAGVRIDGFA